MKVLDRKWSDRYFDMAKTVAGWSKDPSTKVGAVAVNELGQVISQGYNGFPRGISDSQARLIKREDKYIYTVHAEKNLIYNACLNGISLRDSHVFVYGLPACSECIKGLIQCQIATLNMRIDRRETSSGRADVWMSNFDEIGKLMLNESGIKFNLEIMLAYE